MAVVTMYVNTDNVGTEDGTTVATGWYDLKAAIDSLTTGNAGDTVTIYCSGATEDTSVARMGGDGFSLASLTIEANRSELDGHYDGTDLISLSHYRMGNAGSYCLSIDDCDVLVLDGIQMNYTGTGRALKHYPGTGDAHTVKNCRFLSSGLYGIYAANRCPTVTYENNIIAGTMTTSAVYMDRTTSTTATWTFKNNTIYAPSATDGFYLGEKTDNLPTTVTLQGNAVAGATNYVNDALLDVGSSVTYGDNATDDTPESGDIAIGTLADAWTCHGTAVTSDFTVKNTSSNLYNACDPALTTLDITEFIRGAAPNDIGAFELAASGTTYYETIIVSTVGGVNFTDVLTYSRTISPTVTAVSLLSRVQSLRRTISAVCTAVPSVALGVTKALDVVALCVSTLTKKIIKAVGITATGTVTQGTTSSFHKTISASTMASLVLAKVRWYAHSVLTATTAAISLTLNELGNLIPALWRDGIRPLARGLIRRLTGNVDPPFGGEY